MVAAGHRRHQDGVLIYVNPACIEIFGAQSADELLGRRMLDLIEPQSHADVQSRIARILAGETMGVVYRNYLKLDGSVMEIEGKAAPIIINGAPAVQFSMRDVTRERAAQDALLVNRQQLRVLSSRVLAAQETERRRIAHELHDELGQALTAVKINLQAHQRFSAIPSGELNAENIRIVESALQHVRGLALALRPSMLDDLGLLPALRWLCQQAAGRGDMDITVRAAQDLPRLNTDVETACFRITQEALTNIARHAQASNVVVALRIDDDALLTTITDNGVGFDVSVMQARASQGNSIGVLGMRERAELLGGTLLIRSQPGQGCVVELRCPIRLPAMRD